MSAALLRPMFVELIEDELVEGTLYISCEYATAIHLCCCGCGNKVVTPLSPTDWRLIFDGETVSLDPSVGNWSFPCQSHYWVERNMIRWARAWDNDEVELGRRADRAAKAEYFARGEEPKQMNGRAEAPSPPASPAPPFLRRTWHAVTRWLLK